jgi:membrane peptidoglycan carboxypeptidase
MALQRPTQYLIEDRESLNKRIDTFLPYMIEKEIISERLGNASLSVELAFNDQGHNVAPLQNVFDFKAVDTLKAKLLKDFGMSSIYDLNRTDAHVVTTLNAQVTDRVARYLDKLSDHEFLEQEDLTGFRRVNPDLANDVTYSFTLYEKTDVGNVLRVQADTFDGEFNLNENSKLELGSTAKLRTLVTYLDIIEKLHLKYTSYSPSLLQEEHENVHDSFSRWIIDHLSSSESDKSLNGTLEAAMERRYSADHRRGFFTNGGFLRFTNFNFPDYKHDFSVRETIQQSINLSSVRLMEDIVEHTVYAGMDTDTALLEDINHKDRDDYLNRFVQYEGNVFLSRYKKELTNDRARSPEHILIENIQKKRTLTPDHLAIIHTTLYPDKTHTNFQHFVEDLREKDLVNFDEINNYEALHSKYSSERFDLNDRGYVTGLNPMSLWVAQRLIHNPDEPWSTTRLAATDIIKDSYGWLLNTDANTPKKEERILKKQNRRILVMLEKDAFEIIHSSWKKQGFPFNAMVPSLASALGSSADTPSASSELIGIIINNGKRTPITSFSEIRLAEDTPYEQHFEQQKSSSEQVIAPEVAAIALKTIQGVVEHGTARGAYNSVKLSDGRVLTVGGKTGTGDNEKRVRNNETGKLETVKKDRTAIFIFSIGEHHFGAITASVLNEKADDHGFTSSMATAVFRRVAPLLTEVLDPAYGISPEETLKARRLSEKAISMGLSPNSEYRIQSGDNLSAIAAQFENVSVNDIKIANDNISTPELISGKMLTIPLEL